MDFNQIGTFLAVVKAGSFSRAAEELNRTQPAVSLSLKRLEEEVGEPLFDRTSKGGTLTEAGKTLCFYARRMMNQREEALSSIKELHGLFRGRLSLGAIESVSEFLLPSLLLVYRKEHPNIKVDVFRNLSESISTEVLERSLDFGFLSYDPADSRLVSRVIRRDNQVLVVAAGHELAGRKDVTISDLGAYTFLTHNARTPSRNRVVQSFVQAGVPFQISMELDSLNTILKFVAQGMGLAILPRLAAESFISSGGRVVEVPVKDLHVERFIRIVHRREQTLSSAAKAFLDLVLSLDETPQEPPMPMLPKPAATQNHPKKKRSGRARTC